MNETLEHLKLIQGVINRMARVSFLLKGWTVTIAVAVLGFAASTSDVRLAVIALFPAFVFWGLDAYYLRQERLFRRLYEGVLDATKPVIPRFSLDTMICKKDVPGLPQTFWASTISFLHGAVVIIIIVLFILISYGIA